MTHSSSKAVDVVTWNWSDGQLPERHPIYHDAAYQQLFAGYDGSTARVLEGRIGDNKVYLPILVKELGGGVREAYSAYGYGGFLGEISLSEDDVNGLKVFLASESIIALFLRHSPFLGNYEMLPHDLLELNRWTYSATLGDFKDFEDFVGQIKQPLRRSVKNAIKSGLIVSFSRLSQPAPERLDVFVEKYRDLMKCKNSLEYYLFDKPFFYRHAELLGYQTDLVEVKLGVDNATIATALFMCDPTGWVHYHLGVADPSHHSMEMLMANAMFYYGQHGFHYLHFGGGHLLDESDGLSSFKKKLGDIRLPFYCSKIICDEKAYQLERRRLPLRYPSLFLISDARAE